MIMTQGNRNNEEIIKQNFESKTWEYFPAKTQKPKYNILIFHGLAQQPQVMNKIAVNLSNHGYNCYRGSLKGHKQTEIIKPGEWEQNVYDLYKYIEDISDLPILALGYSLGSITILNCLFEQSDFFNIKKIIMISPPIIMKNITKLSWVLGYLPQNITLPTVDIKNISRAPISTNSSYYYNLHRIRNSVLSKIKSDLSIPTMVIGHKNDEILDFNNMAKYMGDKKRESEIKYLFFDQVKPHKHAYYHIITSPYHWNKLIDSYTLDIHKWLETHS